MLDLKLTPRTAGSLGGDIALDADDNVEIVEDEDALHQSIVVNLRHILAGYGFSGRNGSTVSNAIEAARGRLAPIDLEASVWDVLRRFPLVNLSKTCYRHHPAEPGRTSFDCFYVTHRGREHGFSAEEVS